MGTQTVPSRVGEKHTSSRWILILVAITLGLSFLLFLPWGQAGAVGTNSGSGYDPGSNRTDRGAVTRGSPSSPYQVVADLSLTKTNSGAFLIGSTGVYTVVVSNAGNAVVSGTITVTDILTDVLTGAEASGNGWDPCGFTGQTLTCTYSNTAGLGVGSSLPPLSYTVNVGSSDTSVITNTASVTNTNDSNPTNNQDSVQTQLVGADLAAGKTVVPASPSEGSTITYTVTVSNLGPNPTTGVVLTDLLPSQVTYVSSLPSQGTYNNTTGIWTVGSLADGALATLRIVATVDSGTAGNTVTNTAAGLSSNVNDYNLSNNAASASFTVATAQATGVHGRVTNKKSGQPISGAIVQLQDSSNTVYSFTTGANGWYTFTQTTATPITLGNGTVRTTVSGYVPFSISVVIAQGQMVLQNIALDSADLVITKTSSSATVLPGQIFTYTLTINNAGTVAASSVVITDLLPSQLTYISDTSGITHTVPAAHNYVWRLTNSIAANATVSFKIRVSVAVALPSNPYVLTNSARVATTDSRLQYCQ